MKIWIAEVFKGFEKGSLNIATANLIICTKQSAKDADFDSRILMHSLIGVQIERIWRHVVKNSSFSIKSWTLLFEIISLCSKSI